MTIYDVSESKLGIQIITVGEQQVPNGSYESKGSMWAFILMIGKNLKHPKMRGKKLTRVDVQGSQMQWTFE